MGLALGAFERKTQTGEQALAEIVDGIMRLRAEVESLVSLRSLLGLPAGADDEAVRGAVEGLKARAERWESELGEAQGDALKLAASIAKERDTWDTRLAEYDSLLHETRDKLAAADRAGEVSRRARDEAITERDALSTEVEQLSAWLNERPSMSTALEGTFAGAMTRKRMQDTLDEWAKGRGEATGSDVAARISALVREHIVRTTSEEPALEGLLRIERALIEGGKAQATLKRIRARRRRAKAKSKAKRKGGR
jgi:hypothetical protein